MTKNAAIACIYCGTHIRVDLSRGDTDVVCPECGAKTLVTPYFVMDAIDDAPPSSTPSVQEKAAPQRAVAQPAATPQSAPAAVREPQILDWQEKHVILGVYEVRGLLGEGGMGKVYHVHHRGWRADLAVKCPKSALFASAGAADNFERECQTWINLGLHLHTVTCYFVRRFSGVPIVFAEYVDGGSLEQWIRSGRLYENGSSSPLATVIDAAIQMAWGLHHAHEHGLVHQDVKPANVMMTKEGVAKVTDFGIARALTGEHGGAQASQNFLVSAGGMTPAYCSYEQAHARALARSGTAPAARIKLTRQSDIWSWGVSVLEMFTGEITWRGGQLAGAALEDYLAHPRNDAQLPRMPEDVAALLRQCFQQDPAARPKTMLEAAGRLAAAYTRATGVPYPRRPPASDGRADGQGRAADLNNRAVSLVELGQNHEARTLFKEAAARFRTQELMYNYCLFALRNNPNVSVEELVQYVPAQPDAGRHAFYCGMLLLEGGELYKAIDMLARALQLAPAQRVEILNARGIGLLLVGETQPAIASFEAALSEEPERFDILRNLALAHYYDRNLDAAVRLFEQLAERALLDGEDAIRYAAVLSAAGLKARALEQLNQAVSSRDASSAVLLTASELLHGCQSFLPAVTPVAEHSNAHEGWVQAVTAREPQNLRARIDAHTLPARYGLVPVALSRKEKEEFLTWDSPRVGGAIAMAYRAVNKRFRWGEIQNLGAMVRTAALSGIPALLVLIAAVLLIRPGNPALYAAAVLLPSLWALTRRTPAARLARETAALAIVLTTLAVFLYLVVTPTPNTIEHPDYLRNLTFLNPEAEASLPASEESLLGIPVPSFLSEGARWALDQFGAGANAQGPFKEFLVLFLAPALAVFVVWQLVLQRATRRARACHTAGQKTRGAPSGLRSPGLWAAWASSWPGRARTASVIALRRFAGSVGLSHAYLLPLMLVVASELAGRTGWPWLLCIPLILLLGSPSASFAPYLFLPAAALVSLGIGLPAMFRGFGNLGWALQNGETTLVLSGVLRGIAVPLGVMACAVMALWHNPAFLREWRSFNPSIIDIRQLVDPLNIRRFAAPWQLMRPDAPAAAPGEAPAVPARAPGEGGGQ